MSPTKPILHKKQAKATSPRASATRKTALQRRDATGHLNPAFARDLRALSKEHDHVETTPDPAFFPGMRSSDPLAEEMGEEYVRTVITGEDHGEDVLDEVVTEESGGPFIVTTGDTEFADGVDESNPPGATREPFPTT